MKRRSFLASIAGIIAAPFVAKKAVAESPPAKPYAVAVDWCRDSLPDRSSVQIVRVGPGTEREIVARFQSEDYKHNLAAWREKMEVFESMGHHVKP